MVNVIYQVNISLFAFRIPLSTVNYLLSIVLRLVFNNYAESYIEHSLMRVVGFTGIRS